MNPSAKLLGKLSFLICLPVLIYVFLLSQFSPKVKSAIEEKPINAINYDIRTDTGELAEQAVASFVEQAGKSDSLIETDRKNTLRAAEKLRLDIPDLKLEYNETLRIPEVISTEIKSKSYFLTPVNSEKRSDILRNFLKQNNGLIGLNNAQINSLKITADYANPDGNLSYIHFEQVIKGVPVFQGEIKAGFTKRNEIVRIINNLAPNLDYETLSEDFGSSEQAVSNALKFIKDAPVAGQTKAEKFYFPIDSGVARTAWRVLIQTKSEAFYVVVDADTGNLLWRKNLTENQTQASTYNVYGNLTSLMKTADSPAPSTPTCPNPNNCPQPPIIARQNFTLIGNEPPYNFNNLGWIPDGENRTIGNAVEAGIDRDGTNGIDPNGWAFSDVNRNFIFNYNPAPGNPPPGDEPIPTTQTYPPSAFQQGAITHAFYMINRWHDEMYLLGFNEQARNFQNDNFNRGGVGNDSISVEVQDSSGTNGGNFTTTADGGRGRLQLFIWTATTPNRDGALDSQMAIHEVSHGTSSRLHGNTLGLGTNMSRGMSEGLSDFYALALLSETSDDVNGIYSIGCYSLAGVSNCYYGLRRFPMARIKVVGPNGLPHNPLTFRYINVGCSLLIGTPTTNPNSAYPHGPLISGSCDQVHNLGEIWLAGLWEMRGLLIDSHGTAEGNRRSLQYVTDGMKLAPLNPTLLQERDAILTAAQVSSPGDVCAVWRGFAVRGMGFSASIQNIGTGSNNTVVTEAFDLPLQCRRPTRADFDGDGRTDLSVFRPGEGTWYLNRSNAGFAAVGWGIASDQPAPGDFDGDGKTDVTVFRPNSDGSQPDFYILKSSNLTLSGVFWGLPGDFPIAEDFDGDGVEDVTVYRPSDSRFYVLKSINGGIITSRPMPGGTPVSGDFDGDGKGDFATFGNGQWFISKSSDNYTSGEIRFWGLASDKVVVTDYDGDARDDLAVFRPSDQTWYIQGSAGTNIYLQFGLANDILVPGDYDGDGKADIAVYRNGVWYINRSTSGILITQFGLTDDIPIPNRYLP